MRAMKDTFSMRLNRSTLAGDAADLIRKLILNQTLKPGERINEVQLARQMEVSRGPVREALLMLQSEGLVTYEVNRGTSVSTLSSEDAFEIYTMRAFLEGEAAQLALPHLRDVDFKKLEEILVTLQHALQANDTLQLILCDTLFHRTVVDASKHKRMAHAHQQLDPLVNAMYMTISSKVPLRLPRVVEIHAVLVDALKTGDAQQVRHAFRAHYLDAMQELQRRLEEVKQNGGDPTWDRFGRLET